MKGIPSRTRLENAAATPPIPTDTGLAYPMLGRAHINLSGPVDQAMYASFSHQLALASTDGPLVVAISTLGGDPEVARLMGDEIRLLREYHRRDTVFLGKVSVYSAGTVLMAAFPADRRYLDLQLQAYAACDDPEIRAVVVRGFGELVEEILRHTEATPDQLASFLGKGMLLNVATAMGVDAEQAGWPRMLREGCVGGF